MSAWAQLDAHATSIVCGPFGSNLLNTNYCDSGIPMVRPFNLRGCRTDIGDVALLNDDFVKASELKTFPFGTLMFARVGEIGVGATVCEKTTISPNIIAAVVKPSVAPFFLAIFANTKFGLMQLESAMKVVAQPTISTDAVRLFRFPLLSFKYQEKISNQFVETARTLRESKQLMIEAESLLIEALGLVGFVPKVESVNIKSFKDSFASTGRLDAEYYQPKYENLLKLLRKDGLTIADVAFVRSERFQKTAGADFQYLEIGGLRGDGSVASETVACDDAPSRASQRVRKGDIITSTVRPIRRLSALVAAEQDGFVCSSGFVVLEPKQIAAEVLLVYLRLHAICELMDLHTSASLYPAISEKDLVSLPIPQIDSSVQQKIAGLVQQSFTLKAESTHLLEAAKRAVEIAIEQDEAAGMAYLAREGALA